MRYLCYLEDHEEYFEFKPDLERSEDTHPKTIYLMPADEMPFGRPSPQLQLPFYQAVLGLESKMGIAN